MIPLRTNSTTGAAPSCLVGGRPGSRGFHCECIYMYLMYREPTHSAISGRRQRRDVPATSHRLHQQHAGVHAAAEDVDLVALVREGHGLGGGDLQVVVDPAPVAVREELERLLGRLDCAPLLLGLLLEDTESGQVVLD